MRTGTAVGLDPRQVKWVRLRVGLLALGFVPLFAVMAHRAYHLQVTQGARLEQLAQQQYLDEDKIPPRRGVIYDRNGTPLAASVDVDSISADPAALPASALPALAQALGMKPRDLQKRLSHSRHFAWLERGATPAEVTAVRKLGLPGLSYIKEPRRFYPQRELAANVIGFAGRDGEGLEGVELAQNEPLKGKSQSVDVIRDAQRRSVFAEGSVDVDELSGASVSLTLDRAIQHITEVALGHAAAKSQCAGAMAVVMDSHTGEILALASAPTYNPNDPGRANRGAMRDRPVVDSFEPGSTFKTFTMAAALEEKVIRPQDPIFVENGRYVIGKHVVHDDEPTNTLTATQVLTVSSNIGAAKIAEKLGRDRLNAYFKLFGFGEKTGLGLPGEVRGSIPYPRSDIKLANEAFGQGLTASGIQLAAGYAAIANGGTLMRPFLIKKVVDPDGTLIESHGPEPVRRVVSEKTAQTLTTMLETVVRKGGTGFKASMDDYVVAGKTGTAQKVDPGTGSYSSHRRTASFIGFVPAEAPRLVIAVIIDEPKGDKYGGSIAAPAFKEIAQQALPQLGVPPSHRVPMLAQSAPVAKKPVIAVAEAGEDDDGELDAEVGEVALAGQSVVPDLAGFGARTAARTLAQADLEPELSGSGRAVSQSPGPGAVVPRGTKVSVRLESRL